MPDIATGLYALFWVGEATALFMSHTGALWAY